MKTLTINESSEILHCEKSKLLELVTNGKIPGAKIGRSWVFLEEDLYEFVRTEARRQQEATLKEKARRYEIMNKPHPSNEELSTLMRPKKIGRRRQLSDLTKLLQK